MSTDLSKRNLERIARIRARLEARAADPDPISSTAGPVWGQPSAGSSPPLRRPGQDPGPRPEAAQQLVEGAPARLIHVDQAEADAPPLVVDARRRASGEPEPIAAEQVPAVEHYTPPPLIGRMEVEPGRSPEDRARHRAFVKTIVADRGLRSEAQAEAQADVTFRDYKFPLWPRRY